METASERIMRVVGNESPGFLCAAAVIVVMTAGG